MAEICLQTTLFGRQWLSAQHHPGDTVSAPCLLDLVQAAERRLGCHPRRRTELIQQRIQACEQAIRTVLQQTTCANERVMRLAARIERLRGQIQSAEARIQTLRTQPASHRQAGPYSQLNRLIKQQTGWQAQRTRAQAQLTQAAAVAERRRQRLVAEAHSYELECQRLQARYERFRAENHEAKLAWGRPRLGMPRKTDPQKATKQWAIAQAVIEAGPQAAVLYVDESRIELLPLIRSTWHWVGQQIRVPTPGTNVTRALFGALYIRSGQWTYLVRQQVLQEDVSAFLEHLLTVYATGARLSWIIDSYSSHTAGVVKDGLVEHPRLQVFHLPKYCSHLNRVENIWLRLKGQIAANRLYGSLHCLLDALERFFDDMTPELALAWANAD